MIVTYTDGTQDDLGELPNDTASNIDKSTGLQYILQNDGTYGVKLGLPTTASSIDIPSHYQGKEVTVILERGFEKCTSLTSIVLPSTIMEIGNYAFSGCTNLVISSLPDALVTIGRYAFYKCSAITDVTIPSKVDFIGAYAFYKTSLSSATFADGSAWSIGVDASVIHTLYFASAGTGNSLSVGSNRCNISTAADAAKALSVPVEMLYFTNRVSSGRVYIDKCWFAEDWTKQ